MYDLGRFCAVELMKLQFHMDALVTGLHSATPMLEHINLVPFCNCIRRGKDAVLIQI